MQRVLVVGAPGSGKSTLARALGERTGLPVIHLDRMFWRPGWRRQDPASWHALVAEAVARDIWIIEGNYRTAQELALPRADTVLWTDVAPWRCCFRVLWRHVRSGGRNRPDMADGCPDRIDQDLLRTIWNYNSIDRQNLVRRLGQYGCHLRPVILRTDRDKAAFLAGLPARTAVQPQ
ncbi:MAG TPA: AAA family ATPase [Hyphomicrobiaceae bacterium]|nr:AAA family ATPase [Hyphomicrobiaceae bacterium]